MIITQTPVRLSILGSSCDYPSWFLKNGGLVVGSAIDKFSHISVRYLPPFHPYKSRFVYSENECVSDNTQVKHNAIRACLELVGLDKQESPGIEVMHSADLPGRSGTGSSSTFAVGLLNALHALKGERLTPDELARAAIRVEREILGEVGGWQDQYFAAVGGLQVIKFRKSGEVDYYPLLLNQVDIENLQSHLLLFFTGITRTSSDIAKSYGNVGDRTKEQWAMMRLAEDGINAIQKGDYRKLGWLMDQSWRVKASMSGMVTTEAISKIYATARICGSFGGKLLGAGGGGCFALVAAPEYHTRIGQRMSELGLIHIPFKFCPEGSQVIFCQR